MLFLRHSVHIL